MLSNQLDNIVSSQVEYLGLIRSWRKQNRAIKHITNIYMVLLDWKEEEKGEKEKLSVFELYLYFLDGGFACAVTMWRTRRSDSEWLPFNNVIIIIKVKSTKQKILNDNDVYGAM